MYCMVKWICSTGNGTDVRYTAELIIVRGRSSQKISKEESFWGSV
jgi:hypothetical protein